MCPEVRSAGDITHSIRGSGGGQSRDTTVSGGPGTLFFLLIYVDDVTVYSPDGKIENPNKGHEA